MYNKVMETVEFLKKESKTLPKTGIILGSGLGGLVNKIEIIKEVLYKDIPHFPISTVKGHEGKLILGKLGGKEVVVMQGRFHYYEGYGMKEVTFPIYVMKKLGVENLIVSNAAGGINKAFDKGVLMIINDHINFFGTNPLVGKNNEEFGERFPDMTEIYSKKLIELTKSIADKEKISYEEGVYLGVTGPSYETAAEIRAFSILGADAVGMSTVPETITGKYLGLNILGVSCITNMATGIAKTNHSHEEVVKIAKQVEEKFCNLVEKVVSEL